MTTATDPSTTTDPNCLFCKFVTGAIEVGLLAQTPTTIAFRDINPQAPTHVLVVPRRHVANAVELAAASATDLADLFAVAGSIARDEGLEGGYRLVFNTGADAGQTIFHAHLHLLGGRPLGERTM